MIRAHDLDSRAVIDLESAKKIGYIDEILLDPTQGQIAAFRVAEGSSLTGGGRKVMVPSSAVESIGPEAIMIRSNGDTLAPEGPHDEFPRLSKVKGRKVVSEGGKLLGAIDDVLIDGADGRIHGYTLKDPSWTAGLSDLFSADHDHRDDYIRGDTDLRLSEDLLVVPESAVVHGEPLHSDDTDRRDEHHRREGSAIDALSGHPQRATPTTDRVSEVQVPESELADTPITYSRTHLDDARTHVSEPRTSLTDATVSSTGYTGGERWNDVRSEFRSRWEQRTGGRGVWEEHEPSYRYGWEMANRPEYQNRSWSAAEPELRRDWETRHHDRPWDPAMDAIRDAWESVTDRHHASDVAGYRSTTTHDEPLTMTERRAVDAPTFTPSDSRRSLL